MTGEDASLNDKKDYSSYQELLNRGIDLLEDVSYEESRDYFEDLIERFPDKAPSFLMLGGIYRELDMLKESELTIRKALELNEGDYFTQTQLGLTLIMQCRNREAEELLRQSLAQEPKCVGTIVALAEILIENDLLHEAYGLLKQGVDLEPENYWAWLGLGNVLKEQAEYEKSIDAYTRATLIDSENPYPVKEIAEAHLQLGNYRQAEMMFERALAFDPEYFFAKLGLAETFLKLEEYGYCDGFLGELMDENPSHWKPWYIRGQIHLNMGDLQQAEDCFNESISRNSYEAGPYKALLTVYEKWGKVEEAEMTRGRLLSLQESEEVVHDTGLEDIDPSIRSIVKELNTLGLTVHSAHAGSPRSRMIDDPDPARISFWGDYKDAPHHIITICNMAGWEAYYDDNSISAVWGGETLPEISDGWAALIQMARLVMPRLRTYISVVQEMAWERDLKDEREHDKD